jgi:hypothetical protein
VVEPCVDRDHSNGYGWITPISINNAASDVQARATRLAKAVKSGVEFGIA